jgi:iron complex outermembrane recepter protein
MQIPKAPICWRILAVFAGLAFVAATFAADNAARSFDLPAAPAARALKQFSEQAGVQVLFPTDLVEGVRTNAVHGEMTPVQALEQMVAGTPLAVVRDDQTGALGIKRQPPAAPAEKNVAGRPLSGSAEVEGSAVRMDKVEVVERRVDGIINKGLLPTDEDAPLHYDVITRLEIEQMGAANIEEVFRNTPEVTAYSSANQEASVTQIVGPSSLATNLKIRGFDALQTTVLINGRRIARSSFPNLVGASSGDLSRIPVGAIERIEILPSSGSAMYGGGAIGGVINVILRKDYRGRELSFSYGTSTEGGSTEYNTSYMHGFSLFNGRTTGTLSFTYRDRGALAFTQRTAMLDRALRRMTTEAAIGTFTQMPGVIRLSAATGDLAIPGAAGVRYATVPTGLTDAQANALTPASFVATAGKWTPSYDRYADNFIYTPSKSTSISSTIEHELIRQKLTLYSELSFTRNDQPIHSTKFFGTGTSYALSATNPFNPFRTGVTPGFVGKAVILNVLPVDTRPDTTDMRRDSYRAVVGLRGKVGEKWEWTLDGTTEVNISQGDSQIGADNIVLASFFSSTTNAATFAQRWSLYNLLADHRANPAPATVNNDYFNVIGRQRYWQYASNLIARTTGDLFDWRAGTVKTSLGAEAYWWQYEGKRPYEFQPPMIAIMGGRDNLSRDILFTKQGRRTDAVFGELIVPVLSRKWHPLPVQSLDLNFSGRREDANDSKSSTTSAVAARLAVSRDLSIRGSRTEGFFPPEQSNLFLSDYTFATSITNTFTFVDPRRGGLSQVNVPLTNAAGPNPNLKPETSISENYGVVLTPRFLKGLRLSVDYWKTRKIDAIRTPTLQQLLDNEAFFPNRVSRGAKLPTDPASWAGVVTGVDTTAINFSKLSTDGIDSQISYTVPTERWGEFTLRARETFTNHFYTSITPLTAPADTVETRDGALKWKGNGSLFWNRNDWTVGVSARYTHSYKTETTTASSQFPGGTGVDGDRIASDLVWDLQLGYKIAYRNDRHGWRGALSGTQWTLNVLNVFDRMPPWFSTGFYSRFSDPRMRYVSLQVKKTL